MNAIGWAGIGVLLTFSIFLANVIYRTGHLSARVEELEKWRVNMRADMHEISEKLEELSGTIRHLSTIIEERTDKRIFVRESKEERT